MATPLVIDPTGLYFRREGHGNTYIGGMSPPLKEMEPPTDNMDVDYDYFDEQCWPILAHRVKAFENLKVCIPVVQKMETLLYVRWGFQ